MSLLLDQAGPQVQCCAFSATVSGLLVVAILRVQYEDSRGFVAAIFVFPVFYAIRVLAKVYVQFVCLQILVELPTRRALVCAPRVRAVLSKN